MGAGGGGGRSLHGVDSGQPVLHVRREFGHCLTDTARSKPFLICSILINRGEHYVWYKLQRPFSKSNNPLLRSTACFKPLFQLDSLADFCLKPGLHGL